MRKGILIAVIFFILAFVFQSCSKTPGACFTVNGQFMQDTVHANQVDTFNASCSSSTNDFNWQFYNNPDSINFGPIIIKTLKDTPTVVNVFLFVTNGNDYNSYSQDIHVVP